MDRDAGCAQLLSAAEAVRNKQLPSSRLALERAGIGGRQWRVGKRVAPPRNEEGGGMERDDGEGLERCGAE